MSNAPLAVSAPVSGRVRPLLIGELAVVAMLLVAYDHVREFAHVQRAAALQHGWRILDVERALHMGFEATVNHWLSGHGVLGRLSVDYYQYLHIAVAMGLLVACYVLCPHLYRPARNALLVINAVGLAIYALYPVAPPRLLPGSAFLDMVAQAGFGTSHGGPIPVNQYAAMPSLHLAWAMWVMLVGFAMTQARWARAIFALHPSLTAFVVVGTANHYVLDVVVGILLAVVAVHVVRVWARSRNRAEAPYAIATPVP